MKIQCNNNNDQMWKYDPVNKTLISKEKSRIGNYPLCLALFRISNPRDLVARECNYREWNETNKWMFENDIIISMSPSHHFCPAKYSTGEFHNVCSNELKCETPYGWSYYDDGLFNLWIRVS